MNVTQSAEPKVFRRYIGLLYIGVHVSTSHVIPCSWGDITGQRYFKVEGRSPRRQKGLDVDDITS